MYLHFKQPASDLEFKRPLKILSKFFRWLGSLFVVFYRVFLSGHFGGSCRYYPSCSCYGQEAFRQWPPGKAMFLIMIRILKCHPFARGGYDPVPLNSTEKEVL